MSNLTLVNGRRQGISVTDGENIKVSNTTISGVSGTSPGYAIDVEPNKQNKIRNVTIENVITKNCDGGFVVSVVYPNVSSVDGVYFNKCRIENVEKRYSIMLNKCKNVVIKNSYIGLGRNKYSCFSSKVEDVKFIDNVIHTKDFVVNDISNISLIGNNVYGRGLYPTNVLNVLSAKNKIKNKIKNNVIHKAK